MKITNDNAAGAGEYSWEPGEVVEVEEQFAAEILAIKDAGFKVVAEVAAEVEHIAEAVQHEVDPEPTNGEVAKPDSE